MEIKREKYAMGWLPDFPDFRDYTEKTLEVKEVLEPTGIMKAKSLPVAVDLRKWCSPVEDQGNLGSCTAQAGAGIIEYYERKAYGRHMEASRAGMRLWRWDTTTR